MAMQNYMEKLIKNTLDDLIKNYPEYKDIEPYRKEVVALSLNKAEPLYGTSNLGHAVIETKLVNSGFRSKITSIVIESIEKVRANPRG
jgi:hypothetical protein